MIRVLVVDDSPLVRQRVERALAVDPEIRVVGAAPDPYVARDLIVSARPDVVTLDVELPRMDGLTFLRRLMHYHPLPVVILSSLTPQGGEKALEALRAGAVAVINKPSERVSFEEVAAELVATVKAAAKAHLIRRPAVTPVPSRPRPAAALATARLEGRVVAIGASTGGTSAIEAILEALPAEAPPILIVQHMPALFTASFAARLSRLSALEVREASDGERPARGLALVAPGGKHLLLRRSGLGFTVQVKEGPAVNGHCPSVDVLFRSVALAAARSAVGVLLTGMGADGARGLLAMRQAGALTLAQDEASSVVYGMPKAAADLGAAERVAPLDAMARLILEAGGRA